MTSSGIEPATFRFVAQHLNHSATSVPHMNMRVLYGSRKTFGIYMAATILALQQQNLCHSILKLGDRITVAITWMRETESVCEC